MAESGTEHPQTSHQKFQLPNSAKILIMSNEHKGNGGGGDDSLSHSDVGFWIVIGPKVLINFQEQQL